MRILSGICHEEIEGYIKGLKDVSDFDTAIDFKSFVNMAAAGYDVLLVSRGSSGDLGIEQLLRELRAKGRKSQRIALLYGEYDDCCDSFIRQIIALGIYDFHVGGAITSKHIQRLLYRPSGKAKALGYVESRYANEYYDENAEHTYRGENRFLPGVAAISRSIKQLLGSGISSTGFERQVISLISNQATGKSHTAWNLACCLSGRGYETSLLNIDRGYSANLFFDIDEIYYDLLDFKLQNNNHNTITDSCYKIGKLSVLTGRLGNDKQLSETDFSRLLYSIRTKAAVTIIDTGTGPTELTRLSVKGSTCDLLVFDCDIMHYHMNMLMLEQLGEDFVPEKTIAVINNTNIRNPAHKSIYNQLVDTGIPFRDIASISSCGLLSHELMNTGMAPYASGREESKELVRDIDDLLGRLSGERVKKGKPFSTSRR